MGFLSIVSTVASMLFGSSSNGKGIVDQVSDTVDKWHPSETTKHEWSIQDQTAGDASQASARKMVLPTHESWFDILVDALNRLPRPVITFWVIGGLTGLWQLQPLQGVDPVTMNIVWTVVTFWFGSRVVFKDIPTAIYTYHKVKEAIATAKQVSTQQPRPNKKKVVSKPADTEDFWPDED